MLVVQSKVLSDSHIHIMCMMKQAHSYSITQIRDRFPVCTQATKQERFETGDNEYQSYSVFNAHSDCLQQSLALI